MSLKSSISHNLGTIVLCSMLGLSLAGNVYLARKVDFRYLQAVVPIKADTQLPVALHLLSPDGRQTQLNFSNHKATVVYVFSPLCPWCKRNEANIKSLVAKDGNAYRFVGLSTLSTNLKQYVAAGDAPFPVYLIQSPAQLRKLGLVGTPETLVVSSSGKVEKVWQGAYLGANKTGVERYFGVKLPGLLSDTALMTVPQKPDDSH